MIYVFVLALSIFHASDKDQSLVESKLLYYRGLHKIWERDYFTFLVGVFKYKRVDTNQQFVKKDNSFGYTLVDLTHFHDCDRRVIYTCCIC